MVWRAILEGADARAAYRGYEQIVAAVVKAENDFIDPRLVALLFASNPQRDDDAEISSAFETSLLRVVARLQHPKRSIGMFTGMTLDAWIIAHVGDDELVHSLAPFDEALLATLSRREKPLDHGICRGLAGAAIYALERWHRGDELFASECLNWVAIRLTEQAVRDKNGTAWLTGYDEASDQFIPGATIGFINCGTLHGTPGVISVLARIHETGVTDTKEIVRDGIRWLIHLTDTQSREISRFPSKVINGQVKPSPRTSWCVGDTGAIAAIWGATRRIQDDDNYLIELAIVCANRKIEETRVMDGAICHGAAGMAHIMNRYYQATSIETFRTSARYWYDHTLAMRRPELNYGGFGHVAYPFGHPGGIWHSNPELLDGAVGIALALQAAYTPEEPLWDRLFAMD